jgi:hypothetical protein
VLARFTVRQLFLYRLVLGSVFIGFASWYVFVSLVPTDRTVFSDLSPAARAEQVASDTIRAAELVDMLSVTGESVVVAIEAYERAPSVATAAAVRQAWNDFLGVALASEAVTDVHRYFPQIPFVSERSVQAQSFTITYSLYILKFAYFHRIIEAVGTNGDVRTILNDYSSAFGATGSYTDVTDRFFAANSFLRRTVGFLYYQLFTPPVATVTQPEYRVLLETAALSQRYLTTNVLSHLTHRGIVYTQTFNDTVDGVWLPVQKTIFVDTIGNVRLSDRTTKFITPAEVADMRPSLQPGDIFLARKNWYASNVGIPGFWAHAGLYTGTWTELEGFFAELFPFIYEGRVYATLEELVDAVAPGTVAAYEMPEPDGFLPSVVEAETAGVHITSLEYAARVDYFGVVRPTLAKPERLHALLHAFEQVGKPYDYAFSLLTEDEIFCSELITHAYAPRADRRGIVFPASVVTGREVVAPTDILRHYVAGLESAEPPLQFVYFLDGNERTGTARVSDEAAFRSTLTRPKFSFLQE